MHSDRLGHFAQCHWLHRRHSALEEALLPLDDLADRFHDGSRPLVERFDEPAGILQAFAEPGARRFVLRPGLELLIVAAVDQQPRQRRLIELDSVAGSRLADEHVRCDVFGRRYGDLAPRFWIVRAELANHIGEVLVVDAADALQVGRAALRQQLEIVDQSRHRRIVAIGRLRLQSEAFGQ